MAGLDQSGAFTRPQNDLPGTTSQSAPQGVRPGAGGGAPPPDAFVNAPPCSTYFGEKTATQYPSVNGPEGPVRAVRLHAVAVPGRLRHRRARRQRHRRPRPDRGDHRRLRGADDPRGRQHVRDRATASAPFAREQFDQIVPERPFRTATTTRSTATCAASRAGTARRRSTSRPCTRWRPAPTSSTSARRTATTRPRRGAATRRRPPAAPTSSPTRTATSASTLPPGYIRPYEDDLHPGRRSRASASTSPPVTTATRPRGDAATAAGRLPGVAPVGDRGRRHEPRRSARTTTTCSRPAGAPARRPARPTARRGIRPARRLPLRLAAAARAGCSPSRPTRTASSPTALAAHGGRGRVVPDIAMDGDPNTGMLVGETQTFPDGSVRTASTASAARACPRRCSRASMALADQAAGGRTASPTRRSTRWPAARSLHDIKGREPGPAVVRVNYNNGVDAGDGTSVGPALARRRGADAAPGARVGQPHRRRQPGRTRVREGAREPLADMWRAALRRRPPPRPLPRGRADEGVRVRAGALAGVERLDGGHLVLAEVEVEDVEVLLDPLRRDRLGDDDVAELQVPADDDLRRASCRAPRRSPTIAGSSSTCALGQRAPRLGHDPAVGVLAAQAGLLQARVQLDLVDRRGDAGLVDDPLEVGGLEVRDADRAREALLLRPR